MAAGLVSKVVQQLARTALQRDGAELTDGQLLGRFIELRDERAFEALLRRHGPMVMGVCRRVLKHSQEAEDAFQAAFLVLVRKAESIRPREMVGNWLYGVAHRTSLKARAAVSRRRGRERQVEQMPDPAASSHQDPWREVRRVLDRELTRLPDHYRAPIVLCDLEGKGHKEAAQQLGWPQGTLSGRLFRARQMLAKRLTRHGLAISAASLAPLTSAAAALADVPLALLETTFKAAVQIGAAQGSTGLVSANVAALVEGMMKSMLLTKLTIAASLVAAALLTGLGTGMLNPRALAQRDAASALQERRQGGERPAAPTAEVQGILKSVDAAKGTITLTLGGGRGEAGEEKTYAVAKDAEVATGSSARTRGFLKEAKLSDFAPGSRVHLTLGPDQTTADAVVAEGATVHGMIKSVDAANNTITIAQPGRGEDAMEKTFTVSVDAEIGVDDGRGKRFSVKEAKLADLVPGAIVAASLSADQKLVQGMQVEGPIVSGAVKSLDLAKGTITLANQGRGDADEKTVELGKDAVLLIDDGKGRRLSLKEGKLADIPTGSMVNVKLSANLKSVGTLRAQGPQYFGLIKGIDAAKGTLTFAVQVGRGENADERTLPVAKDAKITSDAAPVKLADLKVEENGPQAHIRLSLDQKTIQSVAIGGGRGR